MKNRQYIFVDDSGDPGFKLGQGSSSLFVIAAVLFLDDYAVEKASDKIKNLKCQIGWADKREFKYRKSGVIVKQNFFRAISNIDCLVSIYVVDKRNNLGVFGLSAKDLYNSTILKALELFGGKAKNIHLFIDGEAGNSYRSSVRTFLRKNTNRITIEKLSYRDSNAEVLIQVADMIAGAARASV